MATKVPMGNNKAERLSSTKRAAVLRIPIANFILYLIQTRTTICKIDKIVKITPMIYQF